MAKVKHIHEEYPEHDWAKDENGNIDFLAWYSDETGYGGPKCTKCKIMPLDNENIGPCIVDEYVCPKCGNNDIKPFNYFAPKYNYCPICGESLDWSEVNEQN